MAPIVNVTCATNASDGTTESPLDEDLNALLYIVVTLLFYSMGIVIGIITYLKREQADMEEDKMFDTYMQLKREPFNLHKKERVQQMAQYLKQLEEQREARDRIESWRTVDTQPQSCKIHNPLLQPPYIACSPKVGAEPWAGQGLVPLGTRDGEWGENGGGPALLCSLTLGVCEPLLTPDTIKRVAFPDLPGNESGRGHVSYHPTGQGAQPKCQCGIMKSSTRTFSPSRQPRLSLNTFCVYQKLGEAEPGYSCTQSLLASDLGGAANCHTGDVNPRPHNSQTVFHTADPSATCDISCQDTTAPLQRRRSDSLAAPHHSHAPLARQFSLNLERNLPSHGASDLGTLIKDHILLKNLQSSAFYDLIPKELSQENSSLQLGQVHVNNEHGETKHGTHNTPESDVRGGGCQGGEATMGRHESPTEPPSFIWSPIAPPQSLIYQLPLPEDSSQLSEQPLQLPLSLFQLQAPVDVRPKIFPLKDIPKSMSLGESAETISPETSHNFNKRRLHNPMYDAWKKGNSQTVDIPDAFRSHASVDPSGKSKSHDKKLLSKTPPTRDNERRGALFFTQKALHKDNDATKASAAQRHRRSLGHLGRQESVDSANSRTSELSDSPLLFPSEDSPALNLSSASSTGSTSLSPADGKLPRKIPRLARSETVDTSKLYRK